jgi:hypothetical protein
MSGVSRPNRTRKISDLEVQIKALQQVVRDALHKELSPQEQSELAELTEALHLVDDDRGPSRSGGRQVWRSAKKTRSADQENTL